MSYDTSSVGMIDRFTIILDAFDDRTSRLTLEQLTRRTRLPRSTVHRILNHLVRLDWVERTPSGYRMGRRMLRAGMSGDGDGYGAIRSAAAPLLQELHSRTGMVVHLAVLDAGESVYLD
ncbi:MAG: helix-turn-helix domain-containing protein, partial [Stackebrandtia sp.]